MPSKSPNDIPAMKAKQFKPGQSGNPKGRPKWNFEEFVRVILDEKIKGTDTTKREAVARIFVDEMLKRNPRIIDSYLDRAWPKIQKIEATLPEGVAVTTRKPETKERAEKIAALVASRKGDGVAVH